MKPNILSEFTDQIQTVCGPNRRHPVLWVLGAPIVGKSYLCRQAAQVKGWHYINYTLDLGFLDSLIGREQTYQPEDAHYDICTWCRQSSSAVMILDDIDPLLMLWSSSEQQQFYAKVSKSTRSQLHCGLVLVTHIAASSVLIRLLPDDNQQRIFMMEQE